MDILGAEIEIHFPECRTLKEKRIVLKSLKQKLHDRFGVSVAELDFHDKWQRSSLGIASVSSDVKATEHLFQNIRRFIESDPRIWIIEFEEEWR